MMWCHTYTLSPVLIWPWCTAEVYPLYCCVMTSVDTTPVKSIDKDNSMEASATKTAGVTLWHKNKVRNYFFWLLSCYFLINHMKNVFQYKQTLLYQIPNLRPNKSCLHAIIRRVVMCCNYFFLLHPILNTLCRYLDDPFPPPNVVEKNPPGPSNYFVFQHLLNIWTLSSSDYDFEIHLFTLMTPEGLIQNFYKRFKHSLMLKKETRCIKSWGWKLLAFEDQGKLYLCCLLRKKCKHVR